MPQAGGQAAPANATQAAAADGILVAYNIAQLEAQIVEQRQYKLYMDGVANIKEWGAKGDGVTDDTASVAAAIDAIVQNPVGAQHSCRHNMS